MRTLAVLFIILISSNGFCIHYENQVEKLFPLDEVNTIIIDHKYGNIDYIISEDGDPEIKVEAFLSAEITDYTDTADISILDIFIENNEGELLIKNNLFGGSSGLTYTLDFVIYGPDSINISAKTHIGDINFPLIKGKKKFIVSYGDLTIPDVTSPDLDTTHIKLGYGKLLTDSLHRCNVQLTNAEVFVKHAYNTTIKSSLSVVRIKRADSLKLISTIDKYLINDIHNIRSKAEKSIIVIDNLWSNGEFTHNKGKLVIRGTQEFFTELNTDLTEVISEILFTRKSGFHLNAVVTEGKLSLPDRRNIEKISDIQTETYRGVLGNSSLLTSKFTLINKRSNVKVAWID